MPPCQLNLVLFLLKYCIDYFLLDLQQAEVFADKLHVVVFFRYQRVRFQLPSLNMEHFQPLQGPESEPPLVLALDLLDPLHLVVGIDPTNKRLVQPLLVDLVLDVIALLRQINERNQS